MTDPCQHTARWVFPHKGKHSVGDPLYEMAMNGDEHLTRAVDDVASWADRITLRAAITAARTAAQA